jgi:hypothetical protein
MTTAIDTDVVIALWDKDPRLNLAAQTAPEEAFNRGSWWCRRRFLRS